MNSTLFNRIQQTQTGISAGLFFVVLVFLLWLPFGLKSRVGEFEEWTILNEDRENPDLFIPEKLPTRPLIYAPYKLSVALYPSIFRAYNIGLMGLFVAKSLVVYAILRRLIPQTSFIAFMTATLYMIYPADTGLFSFRTFTIELPILFGLIAIYIMLRYWQRPNHLLWPMIWLLQLLSLLIYEVMYPLMLVSPLLLLWLDRRLTRRFWRISLLWSIIPITLFGWVVFNILQPSQANTYVGNRIAEAQASGTTSLSAMLNRIPPLYSRHVSEWINAITEINTPPLHLAIALLVGMLTGIVSWQHLRRASGWKFTLPLLAAGLAIILLGYGVYLPGAYQDTQWRVYFVSSLGAALFLSALVYLLTRRARILTATISGILMAVAVIYTLNQHGFYVDSSVYVQRFLASMVEQAPQIDPDAAVIVFDDARIFHNEWRMEGFDNALRQAVNTVYDNRVPAQFCNSPVNAMIGIRVCELRDDSLYRKFVERESSWPYDRIVAFRTTPGGAAELLENLPTDARGATDYNPHTLITDNAPLPQSISTFFTCWPLDDCLPLNSAPEETIELDFDHMVRGTGWQGSNPGRWQQWMNALHSTIIVNPIHDQALSIEFRISNYAGQDILDSLKLEVNGEPIPIERIDPPSLIFRGVIPASVLTDETELAFTVDRLAGPYNLSIEFDWLRIQPLQPSENIRIEFDSAIAGTGWEPPASGYSQRWMIDTRATIMIHPVTDRDLEITFNIDLYLQQDILDSLVLEVNGESINLERVDITPTTFRGIIPQSVLRDQTELAFIVNRLVSPQSLNINDDTRELGLHFDWLQIQPAQAS